MNTIPTRLATLQDINAVASLFDAYRQFYDLASDLTLSGDFIRQRINLQESTILVAEDTANQLVGFCQLYPTFCSLAARPICVLYDLFVTPQARKTGAGKALMFAAEQHAFSQGFARLDLSTAKSNLAAQSLYESLGWHRDTQFHGYSKTATIPAISVP